MPFCCHMLLADLRVRKKMDCNRVLAHRPKRGRLNLFIRRVIWKDFFFIPRAEGEKSTFNRN